MFQQFIETDRERKAEQQAESNARRQKRMEELIEKKKGLIDLMRKSKKTKSKHFVAPKTKSSVSGTENFDEVTKLAPIITQLPAERLKELKQNLLLTHQKIGMEPFDPREIIKELRFLESSSNRIFSQLSSTYYEIDDLSKKLTKKKTLVLKPPQQEVVTQGDQNREFKETTKLQENLKLVCYLIYSLCDRIKGYYAPLELALGQKRPSEESLLYYLGVLEHGVLWMLRSLGWDLVSHEESLPWLTHDIKGT